MEVHGEQACSRRQREGVKGWPCPPRPPHGHRLPPTYDHEEDTDTVNVAGAFLGIGVHQEHHERPEDEEGDIAELEKKRTQREGVRQGRQRGAAPKSELPVIR